MLNIGPQELLLILLVALVIVGPKRLPELSRTIGRGLREFRKAQDEVSKTIRLGLDEAEPTTKPAGRSTGASTAGAQAADGGPEPGEPGSVTAATEGSPAAPEPDDAAAIARTLGRGLAEIRRTRQEIQRTFRVDLPDGRATSARRTPAAPSAAPTPTTQAAPPSEAEVPPPTVDTGTPTSGPTPETPDPAPDARAEDETSERPGADG